MVARECHGAVVAFFVAIAILEIAHSIEAKTIEVKIVAICVLVRHMLFKRDNARVNRDAR